MKINELMQNLHVHSYWILSPDGTGSKGDEALVSGCLSLLQGQKALLITPNQSLWTDALIGKTHLFEECYVPLEEWPSLFQGPKKLIVIGADTVDGTCGYESAHWRLEALKAAAAQGGEVVVFCSVRSDMPASLVEEWKALPDSVRVFVRDEVSEKNFWQQVGRKAGRFSDLAFFSAPMQTKRAQKLAEELKCARKAKRLIGLELSETMFRSFNTQLTDENRSEFARQVAALTVEGLNPADTAVVLMSHDTRSWEEHWGDQQYAREAQNYLEAKGFTCLVQPPELTQAELLTLGKFCDLIICGRMHMSVTACFCGVVPLVVAGSGKSYVMIDKVRGMCREWMGTDQNLLLSLEDIPVMRDKVLGGTALQDILAEKLDALRVSLDEERKEFAKLLDVQEVVLDREQQQEIALLGALQRSAELSKELQAEQALRCNKEAHIEQLLQSERELLGAVASLENANRQQQEKYEEEIRQLQQELANREGECQQLRDKENHFINVLEATKKSRTWKVGRIFTNVVRFFAPVGSKRALFCRLLWAAVRHPITFAKNLSFRKIKKFFRLLKRGEAESLDVILCSSLNGEPVPSLLEVQKLEIIPVDIAKEWTVKDFPVLEIPRWEDPQVSIVIPVYNQFAYTYHCVRSILENSGDITYEIIIANDCSTDLTTKIDQILPGVICVTNEQNLRFLRNCNHAAKYAKGKYILFLNNDTQVQKNWLEPLVTLIESSDDIGMVGSKLIYPDGRLQEAGGILWRDGSAWNFGNRQNPAAPQFNYVKQVDYISGLVKDFYEN